jgi:hypothetical protein
MAEVFRTCGQICGNSELKAADSDRAMWDMCGVEAACVYALQSKCNHLCDPSAQAPLCI